MSDIPEVARIPGAEERSLTIDGVTWHYWFAGSGPPLLLIHGFMGYSFSWRFNMAMLAEHFSVYAMDLPGCGFSQRVDAAESTLAGDAEGMLRFMDQLRIEEADVVASSRGGGLSILLAALLAQRNMSRRVRRLILVSPINPWSSYGRFLSRMLGTKIGGFCVLNVLPKLHFLMARYLLKLYGNPERISPGTIEGYEAGLKPAGTFENLLRVVRSWGRDLREIEEALPAMSDVPTLLLWGSRDRAVYPSSADELQRRLRNCALIVLEGVGHLPYEEVPHEFNQVVSDFLLGNAPSTALEGELAQERAVSTEY